MANNLVVSGGLSVKVTIGGSPAVEAWLTAQTSTTNTQLALILSNLALLGQKQDAANALETKQMAALDDQIVILTNQVTANTTVTGSVETFLNGIPQLIADAVAKAQANGATPAQLKAITDLGTALQANSDGISAALVANTPAAAAA